MKKNGPIDKPFVIATIILLVVGFMIFNSASLGLLTRDSAIYSSVIFSQLFFGIGLGLVALLVLSNVSYLFWKKYSVFIFGAGLLLSLLVFVPHVGLSAGGARRWVELFGFSFQPAEFLKIGFVLYFATWLSNNHTRLRHYKYGLIPLLITLGVTGGILLAQPDTGTFLVVTSAALGMYIAAGARYRDFLILIAVMLVGATVLVFVRPYLMDRVMTFLQPSADPQGSGYQINQSLIAIGSGHWVGRGFGQSIQKFSYLPEPIGDSIFSVAAEEFGFIGSVCILLLFLFFAFSGLKIAARSPDYFGGLVVVGIVILIVSQSFMNIASMLGVMPLTGEPLLFISHGGSAMLFALAEVAIILNISRSMKHPRTVVATTQPSQTSRVRKKNKI